MNMAQELGAKKILTSEEQREIMRLEEEARKIKEDYEVPDEAVQVDMFFPKKNDDGSTSLEKTKFYT
jgi:hypothetical protein